MTTRAAAAAETRARIIRAACDVYAREGFRNASIQAIARAASVSPATVLNHFESGNELLAATLAHLTAQLGLPDPAEIEAIGNLERRVETLTRALTACYERGETLYALYSGDQDLPAVRAANDAFFRHIDALVRAALGPGLRSKRTVDVALALTRWTTVRSLRDSGMSARAAAGAIAEVLIAWLRSRPGKGRRS